MTKPQAFSQLNQNQYQAVSAPPGQLLVLAGAGSGKTRVLVNRIAWLVHHQHVSPLSIIAVTFTNKAAGEMRARIEQFLNRSVQGMWVGTFHGLAHRLLRAHWQDVNLPENFQVLDSDDQVRIIKRTIKGLQLDEEQWLPRDAQRFINARKDQGLRSHHVREPSNHYMQVMLRIYQAYEQACQRAGVVDFAELLLRAHELWLHNPTVLQHYQQRFQHLLVDEFQDTNAIQYAWVRLLAGDDKDVLVVGDDDQSIYGWRGARVENIHRFQQDFPHSQIIRLEQNYRSTQRILTAANALIDHNEERLGKKLWTEGAEGEPISLYIAFNEVDEARFIVSTIRQWVEKGRPYRQAAVLYRSNAQSRVLEEALLQANIPYRVYGGLRFFERAEIKDALAYLRLLVRRDDDAAFERVVNHPPRGIGERTLTELRQCARTQDLSLWKSAQQFVNEQRFAARAHNALAGFLKLMDGLDEIDDLSLAEQIEHVIQHSGIWTHYESGKGERAQTRLENLQELVTAGKQFQTETEGDQHLTDFLAYAVLESGEHQSEAHQDCVQLMTLHTAKGLEFPLVFIAGVEEGLFPHQMALNEPGRLEEERRLCYVGMTRAMNKLYLSYAERRRQYGKDMYHMPSRFIEEIPENLLAEVRLLRSPPPRAAQSSARQTSSDSWRLADDNQPFKLGQLVTHPSFGEGTVINYEGSGTNTRVQVHFKQHGSKWLVIAFAKLTA